MSRKNIYYWKCDRPAAFHGTQTRGEPDANVERLLREELRLHFHAKTIELSSGAGQGNHLTWNATIDGAAMFVRVENGPEKDGHLAVESILIDQVRSTGVRTPIVHGCDATRRQVPFAWQALERIAAPDLNHWFKQGVLDVPRIAFDIGVAVAHWQETSFPRFGVLENTRGPEGSGEITGLLVRPGSLYMRGLQGCCTSYANYYQLRLDEHLDFLVKRGFLTGIQRDEIAAEIENHRALLDLPQGCLVHKDLALWNILGSRDRIAAFIDFDDAICGDPTDDLSLLACFHNAVFLNRAFEGYQSTKPLPREHLRRFWLHLLRNMIVKAVIRVGAGYFDRDDGFFLISSGSSGSNLREFTLSRLHTALNGLRNASSIDIL